MNERAVTYSIFESPVGRLTITGNDGSIQMIAFSQGSRASLPRDHWRRDDARYKTTSDQLQQYFAGERTSFDLPLDFSGTSFQNAVWGALLKIPYGETTTYARIANFIGKPKAVRAVGAANGANPLPIIVPCHRVLGSNGALTGFGGGLPAKQFLLELEASNSKSTA